MRVRDSASQNVWSKQLVPLGVRQETPLAPKGKWGCARGRAVAQESGKLRGLSGLLLVCKVALGSHWAC